VQSSCDLHHMQHARDVRWQRPILEAPHLWGRSQRGDPQSLRARRPSFMTALQA